MSLYDKYHPDEGAMRHTSRFPAVTRLALMLDVLGWSVLAISAAVAVWMASLSGWPAVVELVYGFIASMILFSLGALIRIGLAIEQNTRDTAHAIREQSLQRLTDEQRDPDATPS
jgi:hypothetical protein